MYTIIVHAIYWFSWCYVHYWYTHTQRCKYLHVYTFLPIRFLPEAIKRSNSLPIWAAEIDKCHAVVASCEAEVCHIQAEGKPGFQGQGAWDRLGWAWKKIGSSQSQISQTDMTNNSPGGLGVQTFWKSRFRVPMWRRVPLADAVGLRKKRSGQEDYGVVLATLATWRYSERKCKSLRCDLRCDFPQVFTHVSFHQPPQAKTSSTYERTRGSIGQSYLEARLRDAFAAHKSLEQRLDQYRFSYEAPLGTIGTLWKPWGGLNDDVSGWLETLGLTSDE